MDRRPDELLIEVWTLEPLEGEPETRIEVATGDLRTNLFRGVFSHPHAFGGQFTLALDRADTRGPGFENGGSLSGVAARWARPIGPGGLIASLRRFTPETDAQGFPTSLTRSDWSLQARWPLGSSLLLEGAYGRQSVEADPDDPAFGHVRPGRAAAHLRVGWDAPGAWLRSALRWSEGEGLPSTVFEARGGFGRPGLFDADAGFTHERWDGRGASRGYARAVAGPFHGVSLFATLARGRRGVPFVPAHEDAARVRDSLNALADSLRALPGGDTLVTQIDTIPVLPSVDLTDRTSFRIGAAFAWRGVEVAGALVRIDPDTLHPVGLLLDPDGLVLPGAVRTGWEASVRLPLPIGFGFEGVYRSWDGDLPYLPERTWDAAFTYHGIFKESGNLEVWGRLGVTGHDPLLLPIPDPEAEVEPPPGGGDPSGESVIPPLERVPFYQDWFAFIEARIVTVRVFVRFENFVAKPNRDFPGRDLVRTRTLYGIRWTLRN
ncbi:MAG: hypothetical protein D6701_11295 [Gemmatimonadetes bacterium]|nr:MAG: hypothetical protein D6701_11295 [Gemmatimonadota bacterium]